MKKITVFLILTFVMLLAACNVRILPAESPIIHEAEETEEAVLPGWPDGSQPPQHTGTPSESPLVSRSQLYDPSIFVIEVYDKWRDELAEGYYVDYECEIYLHKIDANDNRAVEGSYQGVFWINIELDAGEYLQDMLKDIPGMEASFNVGGEAVADNFGIFLNTEDDKAWVNYNIMGADGKPLPLTQDTPVAKGSFVAVAKDVYLIATASGMQGGKFNYADAKEGDLTDINYIVHVQPDSMEVNGQREVTINISTPNGFNRTIKGILRRLPGYPEDVSDYLNSKEYQDKAHKHLEE